MQKTRPALRARRWEGDGHTGSHWRAHVTARASSWALERCEGINSEHNKASTNSGSMDRQDGRGYQPTGITRASSRRNDIVRGNVVRICPV